MSSRNNKHYMYKNESKEEMLAFTGAYLMAKCMKDTNANVYRLYNGSVVEAGSCP